MGLTTLTEISRYYGANPDYILAGGGNTSFKDGETLYVKGSGRSLAGAVPEDFVKMDRRVLAAIWDKRYPDAGAERESAVLADMMAARKPGEEQKRPSVETLLHDMLPFAYVVHTHPSLVNGLTCSQRGKEEAAEIFGDEAVWIPSTNPGYVLAKEVKIAMDAHGAKRGKPAAIIFLQNHGVFAGADSAGGIKEIYGKIMEKIGGRIKRRPDFSNESGEKGNFTAAGLSAGIGRTLSALAGGGAAFLCNNEIAALVENSASFAPLSSAFTPDHIVYAGSDPLFTRADTEAGLRKAWKKHAEKTGRAPKIVAVEGLGVFGVGPSEKTAALALELFKDAVKVAVFSESFGGPLFMTQDQIDFINNWEAEHFRTSVSAK
jgi:rhamnose utilization protein RhaD (predicted bifunctional aldolase and dehydrogenase)